MVLTLPAWHLAINNLAGRRTRAVLLILAIALATALSVAVSAAMDTMEASLRQTLGEMVGLMDLRIHHRFGQRIEEKVLEQVRRWPQVELAVPRFSTGISVTNARTGKKATLLAEGIDPREDPKLHPTKLSAGRGLQKEGEAVLDEKVYGLLEAQVGDRLEVIRFGTPVTLTVVGVVERPPLAVVQQPVALVALAQAQMLGGMPGLVDEINLKLKPGQAIEDFERFHADDLPKTLLLQTPAASTAGINRGLKGARLMILIVTLLVFLSAGFIILTSLTTAVVERLRELGVLRCIGAGRGQIAAAQLLSGLLLAGAGALLGAPIGLALAYWLYRSFAADLRAGYRVSASGVLLAMGAAVLAGLLGAAYPAAVAARIQPMQALTLRARKPQALTTAICLALGLALVMVQPLISVVIADRQLEFWLTMTAGIPLAFLGYFLLAVPVLIVLGKTVAPAVARLLRLPGTLLSQSILATPVRHGLTGGALMISLALLVSIWTLGRSVMGGWIQNIRLPDAFVQSYFPLTPPQWSALQQIDFITSMCPATLFEVQLDEMQFGVKAFAPRKTYYVSFDPETFLHMVDVTWIQGDKESAIRRLRQGQAVLVPREYQVAHGVNRGDKITIDTPLEGPVAFEVAGVIGSPGLDLAVQFFQIHRAYSEHAISSILGPRSDAIRFFGVDAINLVVMNLRRGTGDEAFVKAIREKLGSPLVVAGTSRMLTTRMQRASGNFMTLASTVAIASLVIACLGVGNLILASIAGRRFEYGVLRAIGAPRGMLGRLVAGETILVALTGCLVGTALGLHLALIGRGFHRRLVGLIYELHFPLDVTAWGWAAVLGAALAAAMPAIVRLVRQQPRDLLAEGAEE